MEVYWNGNKKLILQFLFDSRKKAIVICVFIVALGLISWTGILLSQGRNSEIETLKLRSRISVDALELHLPPVFQSGVLTWLFKVPGMRKDSLGPGYYTWEVNSSLWEVYRKLRGGLQTPISITQPSLRTLPMILDFWSRQLLFSAESLDSALLKKLKEKDSTWTRENAIGLFLPQTYEVYLTSSPDVMVQKIYAAYKVFWNAERIAKALRLGYQPHDIITLASIVQEETQINDEMPVIAGVYLNRLKRGMRLQADPTVRFAVGDFTLTRILFVHLDTESPYNTYRNSGLPPGPINAPEYAVIDAVLNAENHEYLYFCAAPDFSGRHLFAKDFDTHRKNARSYQQALNRLP